MHFKAYTAFPGVSYSSTKNGTIIDDITLVIALCLDQRTLPLTCEPWSSFLIFWADAQVHGKDCMKLWILPASRVLWKLVMALDGGCVLMEFVPVKDGNLLSCAGDMEQVPETLGWLPHILPDLSPLEQVWNMVQATINCMPLHPSLGSCAKFLEYYTHAVYHKLCAHHTANIIHVNGGGTY